MKKGRPSLYTDELAKEICKAISTSSKSLKKICDENPSFPTDSVVYEWLKENKSFADDYARAKQNQIEVWMQETIDIADDKDNDNLIAINRARLRIDTRKFHAIKILPKVYGERITTEIKSDLSSMSAEEIAEAVKTLPLNHKRNIIQAIMMQMQNELQNST